MTTVAKDSSATAPNDLVGALFNVGAHFGYSKTRRHPSMRPLIFGAKDRVEIFDLEKTSKLLEEALAFVTQLGKEGKTVLFVSGKAEALEAVREEAAKLSMPYVAGRWLGGTLTNFSEFKKRIARLQELTEERETGAMAKKYTKKEQLMLSREIARLERDFSGISSLTRIPDALIVVDTRHEKNAVKEANQLNVPVVGIMNSDCDLSEVTHPIVGNDASRQAIQYFLHAIGEAYLAGKKAGVPAPKAEASQE
jgi:small subunit ribosomal protein S2